MSSDQFERYLALGRQAIDEHFIRFAPTKALKIRIEAEAYANPRITKSYAKRNFFSNSQCDYKSYTKRLSKSYA